MSAEKKHTKKAELGLELGRTMAELRNHVRQYVQLKIKEHGVNISFEMLEVMGCLWKKDGINQQELADLTLRDKSSMTYVIDNLSKRGLVKRVEDENDRRNNLIYLSGEGIPLKELLYPWATEVYEMATKEIEIEDLQNTLTMLNKMVVKLKQE